MKKYFGMIILLLDLISISARAEMVDFIQTESYETEYDSEYENETQSDDLYERESEMTAEEEITPDDESVEETEEMLERFIEVKNIHLSYEEGYKIYDGENSVLVTGDVYGLIPGEILHLYGETEKADVGSYPVMLYAFVEYEDNMQDNIDIVPIYIEETALQLEIRPKPLKIQISDAMKPYYSDLEWDSLTFLEEEPVTISGFIEDDEGNAMIPEGFEIPVLSLDQEKIQKDAAMYENGMEIIYQDVITLAYDEEGKLTGNATDNYCFAPEEEQYCKKGGVILSQIPIEEGRDYQILSEHGGYLDEDGNLWIAPGDSIYVNPMQQERFDTGLFTGPLYESGMSEFSLTKRNQYGDVLASSQIGTIFWNVDTTPPSGEIRINGIPDDGIRQYENADMLLQVTGYDKETMIQEIQTYLSRDGSEDTDAKEEFFEHSENWSNTLQYTVTEDGVYRLFVRLTDWAGNSTYLQSKTIIMDRNFPQIDITNVGNGSANRGTVMPVITCSDRNLNPGSVSFELIGSLNGNIIPRYQEQGNDTEVMIHIFDIPHLKEWDDVYELIVSAEDYAGNSLTERIRFSVNRFGSTYYIEEKCAEALAPFYLKKAPDIILEEINVDELQTLEIMVGWENEVFFLKEGKDYTVSQTSEESGWKKYTYHIPGTVFDQDGYYYLVCSSKDRAENISDNRMQKKYLEFALDQTPPEIIVSGLEEGKVYDREKKVHITCIDNFQEVTMQVLLNGKIAYDTSKTELSFFLKPEGSVTSMKVIAADQAGNRMVTEEFLIKWKDESEEMETSNEKMENAYENPDKNSNFLQEQEAGGERENRGELTEKKRDIQEKYTIIIPGRIGKIIAFLLLVSAFLKGIFCFRGRAKE